jgi:SPP1 gp7 family putative phage head morphogenesis protein
VKQKELPPIRETTEDYDGIEEQILKIFRREIYFPVLRELSPAEKLQNAPADRLAAALASGRIRYYRGKFHGKFDAALSKEIKRLGAVWDRATQSWGLTQAELPEEVRSAIQSAEYRFDRVAASIDKKLSELLPAQISENVKIAHFFDRTLWRIDKDFEKQMKGITVVPKLTADARAKVAAGYTKDLQRYIQDFSEKEIAKLRKEIQASAMTGNRYETMKDRIRASYGTTESKAKFLARQETALMMASFKQVRYQEAGVNQYRWQCVVGSPAHPVRPMHLALNGKVFSWDNPPVTDDKGARNNPGQDYNCRCVARPIVKF